MASKAPSKDGSEGLLLAEVKARCEALVHEVVSLKDETFTLECRRTRLLEEQAADESLMAEVEEKERLVKDLENKLRTHEEHLVLKDQETVQLEREAQQLQQELAAATSKEKPVIDQQDTIVQHALGAMEASCSRLEKHNSAAKVALKLAKLPPLPCSFSQYDTNMQEAVQRLHGEVHELDGQLAEARSLLEKAEGVPPRILQPTLATQSKQKRAVNKEN